MRNIINYEYEYFVVNIHDIFIMFDKQIKYPAKGRNIYLLQGYVYILYKQYHTFMLMFTSLSI